MLSALAPRVAVVSWTPLHARLGEATTPLTYELIERACAEGVSERADLDWKKTLPLTADKSDPKAKQHQQLELAKDVAAMANSGGGMIVYGIDETRTAGTSAAERVVAVGPVNETTTRDIRRVAGNLIYPPVVGLELIPLAPDGDADAGVLALLVPDSADRPHLIHPANGAEWFAAPYRHGPDTEWMVERQISAAYTERETGRRRRAQEFDERFDEFTDSLRQDTNLRWVVAFAVPEQPGARRRDLNPVAANRIIDAAWRHPWRGGIGPEDLTRSASTRRGLRRFSRTGSRNLSAAGSATARARVEVHADGAVAVAFTRDGAIPHEGQQPSQVPIIDIETTALDFLSLLMTTRNALRITGDYTARLTVNPPTQIFRRHDAGTSLFVPWDEQDRVLNYRPVDGLIVGTAGRDELLASWVSIVSDAVNQAGASCYLDARELDTALELDD